MKNYEILAGNNLLADFMGATFNIETLNKGEIWLPQHGVCKYKTVELGKGKILEYHKSWNWWVAKLFNKFEVVSFDNLAIEQLNIKRFFSDNNWNTFNQGEYSFYINAVTEEFSPSSRSNQKTSWNNLTINEYFKLINK